MTAHRADVVVVGAGPSGSASALLLARAGFAVILVDKTHFPRPKPCGEYTSPAVAAVLGRLGVRAAVDAAGARWLRGMRLHAPDGSAWPVAFEADGQRALAMPRATLDQILVEAARRSGAKVIEGFRVEHLRMEAGQVIGVVGRQSNHLTTLHARLVIGADGLHSVMARELGLAAPVPWPRRLGLVAHYGGVELTDYGEIYVGHDGYCGLAPVGEGIVNVGLVIPLPPRGQRVPVAARYEAALCAITGLGRLLAGATRLGPVRGVGSLARRVHRTTGSGWLLVGDAAGFLDPFTGDGVYEALRGAELAAAVAARALARGDVSPAALAPYAHLRRRTFGAKRRLGWLLQLFVHEPALLAYALRRLRDRPALAATLVGALGDYRPAAPALQPGYLGRLLRP